MDLRALALIGALAAGPAAAQGEAPAPSPEAGRKAYTSYCARCHGLNLVVSGGAFFDLRRFPADDKARFLQSVSKGLRAMPAWEGIVKPEQIESIWLYIGSVNGWPAPGTQSASTSTQAQ